MKAAIVIAFLFGVLLGLILRRFVSSADPVSQPAAEEPKVEIFTDCNYSGKSVKLGLGNYRNSDVIGLPNDSISSFKIPAGLKVILFEDNDFKGKSFGIATDKPCLTDNSMPGKTGKTWNDQVSSIKIVK
jgi:hypothetical protein